MDFTHILLTAVVFLLAHVEVASGYSRPPEFSMRSYYRWQEKCPGGNSLLKIDLDDCTEGLCAAKLDGRFTTETETRFWIIKLANGKKCIEFRDNNNDTHALKVVNSTLVAFEFQNRGCDDTISNEFQFQEVIRKTAEGKRFVYKYNISNNVPRCLGVEAGCNAALKLITPKKKDRRCFFIKYRPK